MKKILLFLAATAMVYFSNAQNLGIGTANPDSKALLDISSTTKAVLFPRMTSTQRASIPSPPAGLMVYDTDRKTFFHHDGAIWRILLNSDYWSKLSTLPNYVSNTTDSVAIGALIPEERLDVNGNIRSRNNLIASNNVVATGNISGGGLTTSGNLTTIGTSFLNGDITTNSDISINNTGAILQLKSNSTIKGFFQLNGDDVRLGTNSGNASGNAIIRLDGNDRFKFDKNGRFTLQADATPTMYFATGGVNQVFLQLQGQALRISASNNKVKVGDVLTIDDATFKPSTKLYILAQADWKDYASPIVYGMPHYPDSSRLVIAAEDNDLWRSFLPPVDKLPPPLAAKVKSAYGKADGTYSMMPFFDLLALHELGHGFHNQAKLKMHRKWMGELFVNIMLHTYIAENEPGLLPALETFPEMVVAAGTAEYKFNSLADFERLYDNLGMGPKNYGWYQSHLHSAAKNIYNAGGKEALQKLWTALKTHKTIMSDEAFVNMLSTEVHSSVADVYLKWNQ